jgi:carbon storage regulator
MLVLSRKVGEEIIIDHHIHMTVVAVKGDRVRIGISAPKEVVVDRQEVHEKRKDFFGWKPAFAPTPTRAIEKTTMR